MVTWFHGKFIEPVAHKINEIKFMAGLIFVHLLYDMYVVDNLSIHCVQIQTNLNSIIAFCLNIEFQ